MLSVVGVMFAPHHQATADEIVRVVRPGGTIGAGQLDARGLHRADVRDHEAVRPRSPARRPAPAAVGPRRPRPRPVRRPGRPGPCPAAAPCGSTRFATGAEFRDYFKSHYGPTIVVYRSLADDPARVAALDAELAALGDRFLSDGAMEWEYLLFTATRGLTRLGAV